MGKVERLLRRYPVVALLGARQVGKTTLASSLVGRRKGPRSWFDLEDPRDRSRLGDPMLALGGLRGLVVLDEIQRSPEVFASLRVLADRVPRRARFLVLGSAPPELLRQGAETLAGRVAFHELPPFGLAEVGADQLEKLWRRGGFPRAWAVRSESESVEWRRNFIRTFLERDLPQLGIRTSGETLHRFWAMLAHYHGQVFNYAEFARAFGVADTTIRRYLDTLSSTFVVRVLMPFSANVAKRQVKAPKVYVTDSGLLHTLLDLETQRDLERHPKVGASWEGFLLENVVQRLGARREQCFYWATHGGAELDLLILRGSRRVGFEFKRTTTPSVTPSMRSALSDLRLDRLDVVHAGTLTYPLAGRIRAVAAGRLLSDLP
jgi:hypothetical protein